MSDLPITSPSLIRTYGSQPGMVVFLLAASSFIAYTSASIVRVLVSHLRQMSAAFRFGFFLVCAGCLGAISLLAARSVLQLVADRSIQESFSPYLRRRPGGGRYLRCSRAFNLAFGWHRTHGLLRYRCQVALTPDASSLASSH